jgi:hypothetical protein
MTYDPDRPYMVYATAYFLKAGAREERIIVKGWAPNVDEEQPPKRRRRGGKKTRKIRKSKQ